MRWHLLYFRRARITARRRALRVTGDSRPSVRSETPRPNPAMLLDIPCSIGSSLRTANSHPSLRPRAHRFVRASPHLVPRILETCHPPFWTRREKRRAELDTKSDEIDAISSQIDQESLRRKFRTRQPNQDRSDDRRRPHPCRSRRRGGARPAAGTAVRIVASSRASEHSDTSLVGFRQPVHPCNTGNSHRTAASEPRRRGRLPCDRTELRPRAAGRSRDVSNHGFRVRPNSNSLVKPVGSRLWRWFGRSTIARRLEPHTSRIPCRMLSLKNVCARPRWSAIPRRPRYP